MALVYMLKTYVQPTWHLNKKMHADGKNGWP